MLLVGVEGRGLFSVCNCDGWRTEIATSVQGTCSLQACLLVVCNITCH